MPRTLCLSRLVRILHVHELVHEHDIAILHVREPVQHIQLVALQVAQLEDIRCVFIFGFAAPSSAQRCVPLRQECSRYDAPG